MENENLNQSTNNPVQNPVQAQSQPVTASLVNQKGFLPLIFGVIVLLVAVAGGAYYLGTQSNRSESQPKNVNDQPTTNLKNEAEITPTNTPIGNTQTIANWKTYSNAEGKYSIQYPPTWVVEVFKEKYPYNTSYDKGHIVFQSRATTAKEKADDAPGLPVDMATGSIKIITTNSMRGIQYAKISEQDFFNPNNDFWLKGNAGGGGPGTTYSIPEEVSVGGKHTIKQTTHPTTAYEWVAPNQITVNYYIWLGNSANEVVQISFTYDDENPNKDILVNDFNKMISTFTISG